MHAAQTPQLGECERIVVRKADGRVFDLGKPKTVMFRLRAWKYRLQMWIESLRGR